MTEFDSKYDIVDEKCPENEPLRGHYKQCFAHYTIKERLPVTLTQVLDQLAREKEAITEELSEEAREELKEVIGLISKIKYELQTDKELAPFTGNQSDKEEWNQFLETLNSRKSYFKATWLYAECYLYRKLRACFEDTKNLQNFDYFRKQKENALLGNLGVLEEVTLFVNQFYDELANKTPQEIGDQFKKMVKLNLWGNRCDLSISSGKEVKATMGIISTIDTLDENILVNQLSELWELLEKASKDITFDIVMDNSGYELVTDLTLAEFLVRSNLCKKVRFHVKAIPWFVSDVTPHDFHWTLETLREHENPILADVGKRWTSLVESGQFDLQPVDDFWTGPAEYAKMRDLRPDLYEKLGEAFIVMFKGDLNYRKLLADFNWPYTTPFETSLNGFRPSHLVALRTIKADLISGLPEGRADELTAKDPHWMERGEWGLIQFAPKINE